MTKPPDPFSLHNRLAEEKSPYLLQHAAQPVAWQGWNDEAFALARAADKPIFLSIGYSTCHWCHVMAHESFADPQVAALLNESFIAIKVDREERPDIDEVYMHACQAMTGQGGWPLTIVMSPDRRPFFAATYIPKTSRYGRLGLMELLPRLDELWRTRRADIDKAALQIHEMLQKAQQLDGKQTPEPAHFAASVAAIARQFDDLYGGFGEQPKFPQSHRLMFLLRCWRRTGDPQALAMVERTLTAMRRGGMYDQLGGGFHRYSTDRRWQLPHFEKMLYDQALLALAYLEAYQATGRADFAQTAREILVYAQRDLLSPEGGFYCGEDADSEGEEGKYYLWTMTEIEAVLGQRDADFAAAVFGLRPEGNIDDETGGGPRGANVLYWRQPPAEAAASFNLTADEFAARLATVADQLMVARRRRLRPHRDEKILTDWNGLIIAALARAAWVLNEPAFAQAAKKALAFIETRMLDREGRLLHRSFDGQAGIPAFLDDYAFLLWGILELVQAEFSPAHLQRAVDLAEQLITHFWDEPNGGFFFTATVAETPLVRLKKIYDGALSSGNSVALWALVKLARLTGESRWEEIAQRLAEAFYGQARQAPGEFTHYLLGVELLLFPTTEIVIVGRPEADDTRELLKIARTGFHPDSSILLASNLESMAHLGFLAPYIKAQGEHNGAATAFVCHDRQCERPITNPKLLAELLRAAQSSGIG